MPIPTELMRKQLFLTKSTLNHGDIKTARKLQDAVGDLMEKAVAPKIEIIPKFFDNFESNWVNPKEIKQRGVILYLHGGGYTAGSIKYANGFAGILAAQTGVRVFCAAYRLAPEFPYPAAVEDALTAYRYIMETGYAPEDIILCGESAGGGLVWALCLKLKSLQLPLPAAVISISPWTDLTFSGPSHQFNAEKDPTLSKEMLEYYANVYAGDNTDDPFVSPIFGNLANMPDSLIFAGGDEILLDDAIMLESRLFALGNDCLLHIEPGMWHVYILYGIPEAVPAMNKIKEFVKEHLR